MTENPDLHFLLLPLPKFTLLPFGNFLNKLHFNANDKNYNRQHYCTWTILNLQPEHVLSNSSTTLHIETTPKELDLADYDYLMLFGERNAQATTELS